MLKISDFSKLSSISIRMLRFYDEQGILKPKLIKENGYRYYDVKQLRVAMQIYHFRYYGFSTVEIKEIVKQLENNNDVASYLLKKQQELQEEKCTLDEKLKSLTKTIEKLNEEEVIMNYNVEVKEIPRRFMMCKRGVIASYDQEGMLWHGLNEELRKGKQQVEYLENGVAMAIFHDEGYVESNADVEIAVEVKEKKYESSSTLEFKVFEPIKVASITFQGGYEHITGVCMQIAQWLSDNNYEIAGPNFSVYHVGFSQTQNPNEFVTEICYPFK